MEITDQIIAVTLSIVATVVGAILIRWLSPKSKVIWSETHSFTYLLPDAQREGGTFLVTVDSLFVQNAGKKAAEHIEVFFNWPPQYINLWPTTLHSTKTLENGRYLVEVNSLAPGEWFQIERIEVAKEAPEVLRVRTNEGGDAKKVNMRPMRIYSRTVNLLIAALMLIGIFAIIYHSISFVLSLI